MTDALVKTFNELKPVCDRCRTAVQVTSGHPLWVWCDGCHSWMRFPTYKQLRNVIAERLMIEAKAQSFMAKEHQLMAQQIRYLVRKLR